MANNFKKIIMCYLAALLFLCVTGKVLAQVLVEENADPIAIAESLLYEGGVANRIAAGKVLRSVFIKEDEQAMILAISPLIEIRRNIRKDYPEITDKEYDEAKGSVGWALLEKYGFEKGIGVLIEEAGCLRSSAQIMMEVLYQYAVEGCPRYDKRILQFFEQTAEEGLPRSLFFLGQIYKHGWGVKRDAKKAQMYLDRSRWKERGFELPSEDLLPILRPGVNSKIVTA